MNKQNTKINFKDFCINNNIKITTPYGLENFNPYAHQIDIANSLEKDKRLIIKGFRKSGITTLLKLILIKEFILSQNHTSYIRSRTHYQKHLIANDIVIILNSINIPISKSDKGHVVVISNPKTNNKIIIGNETDNKLLFYTPMFPFDLTIVDDFSFQKKVYFIENFPSFLPKLLSTKSKIILSSTIEGDDNSSFQKLESHKLFTNLIEGNVYESRYFTVFDLTKQNYWLAKSFWRNYPNESVKVINKLTKT